MLSRVGIGIGVFCCFWRLRRERFQHGWVDGSFTTIWGGEGVFDNEGFVGMPNKGVE